MHLLDFFSREQSSFFINFLSADSEWSELANPRVDALIWFTNA
jgi:hypothetical protein